MAVGDMSMVLTDRTASDDDGGIEPLTGEV
jgi:hypothetical protein